MTNAWKRIVVTLCAALMAIASPTIGSAAWPTSATATPEVFKEPLTQLIQRRGGGFGGGYRQTPTIRTPSSYRPQVNRAPISTTPYRPNAAPAYPPSPQRWRTPVPQTAAPAPGYVRPTLPRVGTGSPFTNPAARIGAGGGQRGAKPQVSFISRFGSASALTPPGFAMRRNPSGFNNVALKITSAGALGRKASDFPSSQGVRRIAAIGAGATAFAGFTQAQVNARSSISNHGAGNLSQKAIFAKSTQNASSTSFALSPPSRTMLGQHIEGRIVAIKFAGGIFGLKQKIEFAKANKFSENARSQAVHKLPNEPAKEKNYYTEVEKNGQEYTHKLISGKIIGSFSAIKEGPLPTETAKTFSGARYKEIVTNKDIILYKAGNSLEPKGGQYFTQEKPSGIIQARIDSAIRPQWDNGHKSQIDAVITVKIPAGTKIYVGEAGYQKGHFVGGTEQIFVSRPFSNGAELVQVENFK